MDPLTMIDRRLDRLETKVDKLLSFKWQMIGGSVALSLVLTIAFQVASIMMAK